MTYEYSEQTIGGIRFRLDISMTINGAPRHISYTTDAEGSGLFFHNGHGDRLQIAGSSQFGARTLRQFKTRTHKFIVARREQEAEEMAVR